MATLGGKGDRHAQATIAVCEYEVSLEKERVITELGQNTEARWMETQAHYFDHTFRSPLSNEILKTPSLFFMLLAKSSPPKANSYIIVLRQQGVYCNRLPGVI